MIKGFREFVLRGNVLDLAVAVVIGTAFGALVAAFTRALIQPLINTVLGGGITGGKVKISDGQYLDFGLVLNAIITFLITATVIYFVFVLPMNRYKEYQERRADLPAPAEESELDVLKQIRDSLGAQRGDSL
jgi:large conductance mechanosensitive channel